MIVSNRSAMLVVKMEVIVWRQISADVLQSGPENSVKMMLMNAPPRRTNANRYALTKTVPTPVAVIRGSPCRVMGGLAHYV